MGGRNVIRFLTRWSWRVVTSDRPKWHPSYVSQNPAPRLTAPALPAFSGTPRVLLLGGAGRSGATVLERVLGELPGACSAGELVHLWQRGVLDDETCGCGESFGRCPFWVEVGARAFNGWNA